MERIVFLFFFTLTSTLLDFYFYQIIKKYRIILWTKPLFYLYWSFTIITITNFFIYAFSLDLGFYLKAIIFNMIIGNFISKLVALPFLLIDDLRRMIIFFFRKRTESSNNKISRSKFLSISASLAYGLPITSLTYGILSNNVYDYRVKRRKVSFNNLPSAFDGIKICHISDIHVGSLKNRVAVRGGLDMILNEKPDAIFFTGDLVNDKAEELKGWGDDLSKLKAPLGVHSVLGNHDYGEYTSWKNESEKNKNFNDLIKGQ
ncbi:MAG: metallophosphatase, partial [Flammeovirgaceae bacterium]|nr:metallophosphatase [Flammeovirgaceae bacterium]